MSQKTANFSNYLFTFQAPDRLGVLAKTTGFLYNSGAYIKETSSYIDPQTERFFFRCMFDDRSLKLELDNFQQQLQQLAQAEQMDIQFRPQSHRPRVLIAVSKLDHCLQALLAKWQAGELAVDIVGVISNHRDCEAMAKWYHLPYHYLPITLDTKPQQEQQILDIINQQSVDLLVLARYMQILSDDLCSHLQGRAINIHHSFLPGFKGARPYHQAYDRGVKVMGATAHYVNRDLDEGPIIVQEVKPIDHELTAEQMVHMGRDIEATALTQAVKLHAEMRVLLNGQRTVVL